MTTINRFKLDDIFNFSNVTADLLTEIYSMNFYIHYMIKWPSMFRKAVHPNGEMMGYYICKAEGTGENWHTHVSAVTVAPKYRRIGISNMLMSDFEELSISRFDGYFADLFVRKANEVAIKMYSSRGYVKYREIKNYYGANLPAFPRADNGYDMRLSLPRDKEKKSSIPHEPFLVRKQDLEYN